MRYRFYLLDAHGGKVYLAPDNTYTKDETKAYTACSPWCNVLPDWTLHVEAVEEKKWYVKFYSNVGKDVFYALGIAGKSGNLHKKHAQAFDTRNEACDYAALVLKIRTTDIKDINVVQE